MDSDFEHAFFFGGGKLFALADGNGSESFVADGGSFAEGDNRTVTIGILVVETLGFAILIDVSSKVLSIIWSFAINKQSAPRYGIHVMPT